jgi:hypothetical protein
MHGAENETALHEKVQTALRKALGLRVQVELK